MRFALAGLLSLVLVGCVSEKRIARGHAKSTLGVAYLQEGNPEGAVAALREAVKLDPRNWHARNALAMAYAAKGSPELAEAEFKSALRINPGEGEILLNYGAFLVTTGRPKEAIGVLETALADLEYRNPGMVLSNLSRAHLDNGEPEKAAARAEDALRRVPKMCPARFHLGLAHEALGKTDAALRDYAVLAEDCPNESLGGWLRTGCILAGLGDYAGADAALRHVTDVALDTPMADEARSCLQRGGG
jgi:type IV pilus biogenesis/stability protein PilW